MISSIKPKGRQKGFTILEMLLVVALFSLVAGMGVPLFQNFQLRNDLTIAAESVVYNLRRAQVRSQAMDYDTTWGVHVATSTITLFQGSSFLTRNASFDEVTTITTIVEPTGTSEFVFSKFTGEPQNVGTLTLTTRDNGSKSITINEKGMVEY